MPCLIKDWMLEIIAKFSSPGNRYCSARVRQLLPHDKIFQNIFSKSLDRVLEKLSNSPLTQSIQGLTFNLFEGFFVDLMGEPHSD